MAQYVAIACDLIERTPAEVTFHRVTGTATRDILLAPDWCTKKWAVLNGIEAELRRRGTRQGLGSTEYEVRSTGAPERRSAAPPVLRTPYSVPRTPYSVLRPWTSAQ